MNLLPIVILALSATLGFAAEKAAPMNADAKKLPVPQSEVLGRGGVLVGANGAPIEYSVAEQGACDAHAMKTKGLEAMKKAGASIDEQAWPLGLVAMISSDSPKVVAEIQKLAQQQGEAMSQLDKKKDLKLCQECVTWMGWMIGGQVMSDAVAMKNGVVLISTGKSPEVVMSLHLMLQKEQADQLPAELPIKKAGKPSKAK